MTFQKLAKYLEEIEETSARNAMIEILARLYGEVSADEARQITYLLQGRLAPKFIDLEIGVADRMLLEAIAQAFGRDRADVDALFQETGDLGSTAERLTERTTSRRSVGDVFDRLLAWPGPRARDRRTARSRGWPRC